MIFIESTSTVTVGDVFVFNIEACRNVDEAEYWKVVIDLAVKCAPLGVILC
jgi:hypothetical protein